VLWTERPQGGSLGQPLNGLEAMQCEGLPGNRRRV